jgi:serine phosphatase RsbU (regulator of sigma subunit)
LQTLQKFAHLPLDEIIAELAAELHFWRGSTSFDDDVSLLAIEKFSLNIEM